MFVINIIIIIINLQWVGVRDVRWKEERWRTPSGGYRVAEGSKGEKARTVSTHSENILLIEYLLMYRHVIIGTIWQNQNSTKPVTVIKS